MLDLQLHQNMNGITNHSARCHVQEEQRVILDEQVHEKQRAKVQQQQAKVQDAQDLAAAVKQHKLDEAKSAAARKAAALKSKALMANQVCFCSSWCSCCERLLSQLKSGDVTRLD